MVRSITYFLIVVTYTFGQVTNRYGFTIHVIVYGNLVTYGFGTYYDPSCVFKKYNIHVTIHEFMLLFIEIDQKIQNNYKSNKVGGYFV